MQVFIFFFIVPYRWYVLLYCIKINYILVRSVGHTRNRNYIMHTCMHACRVSYASKIHRNMAAPSFIISLKK